MENYLFYEPLQKLKAAVECGDIGDVSSYHMKMVGSGLGGWDVPISSWLWQWEQMKRGRGILVFDDGWHKLATAIWLFGPVREVRAWIGNTAVGPASTSTRRPRSCGSTTTVSAACEISTSRLICTCGPITTSTTNAGR